MTAERECSFIELIKSGKVKGLTSKDLGSPTFFISHAWKYNFLDCVSAIKSGIGNSATPAFVWFDMCIVNQHDTAEKPFDWWCTTFKHSVKRIGHTLLILLPWQSPEALKRAWCLWEIF